MSGASVPDTLAAVSPARRSKPTKQVRVKVSLLLTQAEIERLESRAAGEVRPIGNYVAWVIEQHLAANCHGCSPNLGGIVFGVAARLMRLWLTRGCRGAHPVLTGRGPGRRTGDGGVGWGREGERPDERCGNAA